VQPGYANDMPSIKNHDELCGSAALGDLPNQFHRRGENCLADELPDVLFDGASFGQWYSFAFADGGPGGSAAAKEQALAIAPLGPSYGDGRGGSTTRGVDEAKMAAHVKATVGAAVTTVGPKQHIRNAMKERYTFSHLWVKE
jgi:hypothetical protein